VGDVKVVLLFVYINTQHIECYFWVFWLQSFF
jgi:hypothetical protein